MLQPLCQLKVMSPLLLPALHQSLLYPLHFQLSQPRWWRYGYPSVCTRGINSLWSENISCLIHWLQLSLGTDGLLSSSHAARSRSEWSVGVSPSTSWTSKCQYSGLRHYRSSHASYPPHVWAKSFLATPAGLSGFAATDTPWIQLLSLQIPAWGNRVLYWGCWTSLWHHNVHPMSVKCHSG